MHIMIAERKFLSACRVNDHGHDHGHCRDYGYENDTRLRNYGLTCLATFGLNATMLLFQLNMYLIFPPPFNSKHNTEETFPISEI